MFSNPSRIISSVLFDSEKHKKVLEKGKHDKCEFHGYELLIIFRHSNNVQKICRVITMRKKKVSKPSKNFSRIRERKVRNKRDDVNKSRVLIKVRNNIHLSRKVDII